MKRERRHELKENQLRSTVFSTVDWLQEYKTSITLLIAIVVIAVVVIGVTVSNARQHRQDIWRDFSDAKTAEDFQELLSKTRGTNLEPMALYHHAGALFDKGKFVDAQKGYEELISRFPDHKVYPYAQQWLGFIYEELGQPDRARERYQSIKDDVVRQIWTEESLARLDGKEKESDAENL